MKSIKLPFKMALKLIGEQEFVAGKIYRPLSFVVFTEVDGVNAAYNTLTGELLLLNEDEIHPFTVDTVVADDSVFELIKKHFLVPVEHDDMQLRDEIVDFCKVLQTSKTKKSYTILPTTDCNARCFYCFEHGKKHMHMSDEIAKDTVKYILRTGEKKVKIKWFGGEPLYNIRAIDIIVNGLKEADIEIESSMTTNAYLFDDAVVKKAVNDWHLDKVQVTLDGTEEVYNRIKAYIYNDGRSPFKIVMDNIERLLKAEVAVLIRLNVDIENFEELMNLVDVLYERFGGYNKFKVYSHKLFEISDRPSSINDEVRRSELDRRWLELEHKISRTGLGFVKKLESELKCNRCMSDSSATVMVLPDGHLGKCEHFIDSDFVGDIYNGETDEAMIASFSARIDKAEICKGCKLYPSCIQLERCTSFEANEICDESTRRHKEQKLYQSVEREVKKYLSKQ